MTTGSAAPLAPTSLTHREIIVIILGILLAMLLSALDQTIVVTAMPTIGRELGGTSYLPWVITAYLLTSTAVTPLYGKVSDIIGRRVTLLFAIVIFVAGSVACAVAPSMIILILARAVQGLGGGGLISLAQTIIADIVSPKERARYQVYVATVFVTSSVAGPLLGGFFAEQFHWSLIFWINLPLGLVAFAMVNGLLKKLPRYERPHQLDFLGAGLMVAATVLLMLALNWGGNQYSWGSWKITSLLALSVMLWILFILRLRSAPEPFIPTAILGNPVVSLGIATAGLGMGVFIGLSAFLPIYFETAYGLTASQSGLALIPFMIGTVTGATLASRNMAAFKHYKRFPLTGLGLAAVMLFAISFAPHGLPLSVLEILLPCVSIGLGSILPVTTVAVQNAVLPFQMGTATGTMNFFRSLGGAIIVAGFGAILSLELRDTATAMGNFRPLFAVAGLALALSFGFFWRMPERPLRTAVNEANIE
jgi:EmrB/QacA subfamily drug resistance transporter